MHVGVTLTFQNLHDRRSDEEIDPHEVSFADRADPVGVDFFWTAEHHVFAPGVRPRLEKHNVRHAHGEVARVQAGAL